MKRKECYIHCPHCNEVIDFGFDIQDKMGIMFYEEGVGEIEITSILCPNCGNRISKNYIKSHLEYYKE